MRVFNTAKISNSPQETFNLGLSLAKELNPNCCLLISGALGAGKTQFIKGICSYFGIEQNAVQSPTYSLHHRYEGTENINHFDCYRLNDSQEFLDRGFLDILDETSPILIEWPSKIDSKLFSTKNKINITIDILSDQTRKIEISYDQN